MFNSLLLFGSSYNKNKKLSIICYILLIANLLIVQVGKVNIYFLIANILIMSAMPLLISKIQNKYVNAITSVGAILVWSILIDVICYYMFPVYPNSLSIFTYVFNGIVFNFKFVFYNTIALAFIESIYCIKNFVVTKLENKDMKQQLI